MATATLTRPKARRPTAPTTGFIHSTAACELWHAYGRDRTDDNRNALVEHYAPWARRVALTVAKRLPAERSDLKDDCVQAAMYALLFLVERYDPSMGIPFTGFAYERVYWAAMDSLRSSTVNRRRAAVRTLTVEFDEADEPTVDVDAGRGMDADEFWRVATRRMPGGVAYAFVHSMRDGESIEQLSRYLRIGQVRVGLLLVEFTPLLVSNLRRYRRETM